MKTFLSFGVNIFQVLSVTMEYINLADDVTIFIFYTYFILRYFILFSDSILTMNIFHVRFYFVFNYLLHFFTFISFFVTYFVNSCLMFCPVSFFFFFVFIYLTLTLLSLSLSVFFSFFSPFSIPLSLILSFSN